MSVREAATVTLRRVTPDDAELVRAWRGEEATRAYQPIARLSLDEVRRMLRDRAATRIEPTATGKLQWIIVAGGEPAGWISLDILSREHATAAVGYTVTTRLHGRGIGTAALVALLPTAFEPNRLNLARLEGVAAIDNVASRRVMERAGFRQEGLLRSLLEIDGVRVDHALYALVRTDWLAARGSEVRGVW